ncbi:carboxymethylenebutenolidase [Capronia epimyces CBS 606.96]|uniref:Carboxymethylenebutenolidase n=1 Tax=Capronia epimyces CBS 606.96 TaxID=1182542 RepID=W9Z5Z6_9EURO|nr:carboxymethylenebutenolidase [Capronia epimyces CBS 606.96]EXJ89904.1 carboxymethylenebutenolidase [Capronia epimyces CBS 606.96]
MAESSSPSPDVEEPVQLPTAELVRVDEHISLLPPLSRRGYGPGLIIILPEETPAYAQGGVVCEDGVPPPLLKWAEEGFATVEIREAAFTRSGSVQSVLGRAVAALGACERCREEGGIGVIVFDSSIWSKYLNRAVLDPKVKAVVVYGSRDTASASTSAIETSVPCLQHLAGAGQGEATDKEPTPGRTDDHGSKIYTYPTAKSGRFALPRLQEFDGVNESISHTRNLGFLKKYIRGADFDIEAVWEEHTYFEFAARSVPKTMGTMVQEPYVNHIPTMTGGIGRERLTNFYRYHFIFNNPDDTELVTVSRTIGIDRICDEFIFKFTHDREIDWLIPGIPPTGRKVEVPFTSVVCVRGDRLYHEHIAWDQASVLVQLGLMPEYLPFPYPLPDGTRPGAGKRFEYRVPTAGIETSLKMLDRNGVSSNSMLGFKIREVDL